MDWKPLLVKVLPYNSKEKREEWKKRYRKKHGVSSQTVSHYKKKEWIKRKLGNKCANPFDLPHYDWMNNPIILEIHHPNGRENGDDNPVWMRSWTFIKAHVEEWNLLCPCCHVLDHRKKS